MTRPRGCLTSRGGQGSVTQEDIARDAGVQEIAWAKINLALHVRARRKDGYHEIESLFAFVDDGDRIDVCPADGLSLAITGPFGDDLTVDDDNLVLRAAHAMQAYFGVTQGAAILLDKRLPIAAGLGGGSADAAAVARALNRLWGLGADDASLISAIGSLGADVPVCVASRMVTGRGVGDEMTPFARAPEYQGRPLLLVNPCIPCPTGPVFRVWDGLDRGAMGEDAAHWRNDLEAGAVTLVPVIADVLDALHAVGGAERVRMSGSGATCFALFYDVALRDDAAKKLRALHPDWWTMTGALL
ncbi:MAG: 4-(cytidine 5'-diphospho)-2-C-methyl-D-erythritol kinase [Sphingobium sp.]|nr:4-(cytidine 5'-diphospho)-2-C-methyl-D-erythritol kinase [Sphingobium sp.]